MLFIRDEQVLINEDLAALYQVETRVLKQAVRRISIGFRLTLCSNST